MITALKPLVIFAAKCVSPSYFAARIAVVAAAVYAIYRFMTPDYLEDFDDDFDDDFDEDFFDDEDIVVDESEKATEEAKK